MAEHSFLKSTFPVVLPIYQSADSIVERIAAQNAKRTADGERVADSAGESSAFVDAMKRAYPVVEEDASRMRTANGDVTFVDTNDALVDLFSELDEAANDLTLQTLLEDAWKEDPDVTLKIIWNSRSIHLGKSSRQIFYRSVGWLYETHLASLLENLPWLVRPVIQKKAPKPNDGTGDAAKLMETININDEDSDFELVEAEQAARPAKRARIEEPASASEFDIKYGVAHGYWKDLLNILTLASLDKLTPGPNMREVFNVRPETKRHKRDWTPDRKKDLLQKRYTKVVDELSRETRYAALHMRVAELFAEQLRLDLQRLESKATSELKRITMAAKWAPSNKGMHDEHTFVVSTIAELLYPRESLCPEVTDREVYLRQARVAYQSKTLSPLRKHLDVVERHIADETFEDIKYDRVPSLALKQYTSLFSRKDREHFTEYVNKVALGEARISGAVLQPATMVAEARSGGKESSFVKSLRSVVQDEDYILTKVADGQWNTLVQRIKESGTLESSIAICDVSGSMFGPCRSDGTTPLDASVGMSLLLAEVVKPPFGGGFITFSEAPAFVWLGPELKTFTEKVRYIQDTAWGGTTNFVAVFRDLILPHARKHKLKQEDMVKRVFVFSDMQFNQAQTNPDKWSTSFHSIKQQYANYGYEMPELVFWNLAASNVSTGRQAKPVQAEEEGTALISGYSQAMMKVFLDGAGFEDAEDPGMEDVVVVDESGKEVTTKAKMTPYNTMMRAIGHDAYRMLKAVD